MCPPNVSKCKWLQMVSPVMLSELDPAETHPLSIKSIPKRLVPAGIPLNPKPFARSHRPTPPRIRVCPTAAVATAGSRLSRELLRAGLSARSGGWGFTSSPLHRAAQPDRAAAQQAVGNVLSPSSAPERRVGQTLVIADGPMQLSTPDDRRVACWGVSQPNPRSNLHWQLESVCSCLWQ
jgi:hypothetical protein